MPFQQQLTGKGRPFLQPRQGVLVQDEGPGVCKGYACQVLWTPSCRRRSGDRASGACTAYMTITQRHAALDMLYAPST